MESVVIDQSLVKPGKAFAMNAGRLAFNSYNPCSSSPLSPLSLNVQGAAHNSLGLGLFGCRPPPYASFPPFPSSTPFFVHQPPLLPFPILRSTSLPPPAKRVAAANSSAVKPRDHHKKRKPRKERRLLPPLREATPVVPKEPKGREEEEGEEVILLVPEKPVLKPKEGGEEVEEEEKERVGFTGSLYTIAPPPSSLPLPSFFLKPKTVVAGASCTMEAMGDSSSGKAVDACATDELRRLLGL